MNKRQCYKKLELTTKLVLFSEINFKLNFQIQQLKRLVFTVKLYALKNSETQLYTTLGNSMTQQQE